MRYKDISKSYKPEKKNKLRPYKKIPKVIKDKPSLDTSLIFIWDSFVKLGSERLKDFGEIPESKIYDYYLRYYKTPQDYDSFYNLIQKMDKIYLKESQKKIPKASVKPTKR